LILIRKYLIKPRYDMPPFTHNVPLAQKPPIRISLRKAVESALIRPLLEHARKRA
jgi:hypothetical protein